MVINKERLIRYIFKWTQLILKAFYRLRFHCCLEVVSWWGKTFVWKLLKFKPLEIHTRKRWRNMVLNIASGCPFVGCDVIALVRTDKVSVGFHYRRLLVSVWCLYALQKHVILKLHFCCFSIFAVSLRGINYPPDILLQHSPLLKYKAD